MLRQDAKEIIQETLAAVLPDAAVARALRDHDFGPGHVKLLAIGKAAWRMAQEAQRYLGDRLEEGMVITKYDHVGGPLPHIRCREAGHPIPDRNSLEATREALHMIRGMGKEDWLIFLVSGGGSALFSDPMIPAEELQEITRQMLASGANIQEMNTIRKHLSHVKGGRFAQACAPGRIYSIVLSDILGDPLDMIASGPAYPDSSTSDQALALVKKYGWKLSEEALWALAQETPKELHNVKTVITGSVSQLCLEAALACEKRGYSAEILTDLMDCQAKEAGAFLGAIARSRAKEHKRRAIIAGGETVVQLKGKGLGGRNQELALAAAEKLDGLSGVCLFSIGSDGTDGPTDAAGGYVDGATKRKLEAMGISIYQTLEINDSYHALEQVGGLLKTGPTGTNVNDVTVILMEGEGEK